MCLRVCVCVCVSVCVRACVRVSKQALQELESVSSAEEFNDLCHCLTLPGVCSHPSYSSWTPHLGRLWCFEALRGYLGLIFPGQEPSSKVNLDQARSCGGTRVGMLGVEGGPCVTHSFHTDRETRLVQRGYVRSI